MFRIAIAILAAVLCTSCRSVVGPSLVLDADIWVLCPSADSCSELWQGRLPRSVQPTLEFQRDGHVVGYAVNNTFFGHYTTSVRDSLDQLRIQVDGMTLHASPHALIEGSYLERLGAVRSYTIRDKHLILRDSTGCVVLIFIPASMTQKDSKQ